MSAVVEYGFYLGVLVALALPLGAYMGRVMNGERVFLSPVLGPVERGVYRLLGVGADEEMGWKRYAACALLFNAVGLIFLFLLLLCQGFLRRMSRCRWWSPLSMRMARW